MKTILNITGMNCASCAANIGAFLKKVDGVSDAHVNYAAERATIEHDDVPPERLVKAVQDAGYEAELHNPNAHHDHRGHHHDHAPKPTRIIVAAALAVPLLILAMGPMLGLPIPHSPYLALIEGVLALAILLVGADVYRAGTIPLLKTRRANMDTLIALGTGVAFLYSAYITLRWLLGGSPGALYFESAGLIMAFILLGRHLEEKAKHRTKGSLEALLKIAPEKARLMVDDKEREVPVSEVQVGDRLRVKPGDKIPVDGTILVGATRIDESMLTGEPKPVKKTKDDEVFAGTINTTGMFFMRADKVGSETAFQRIVKLVEEAQQSQAPVQRLADQVSAVFVPSVIVLAVLTFGGWLVVGASVPFALTTMIAVLIIACPCALGLATPTAIMVATGTAGRRGVLFKDAKALQKASEIKMVAFDKTGTLTQGKPAVVSVRTYYDIGEESMLRYAASLESGSEHPLARAIVSYAEKKNVNYGDPRTFEAIEGRGVRGKVEGRKIMIGSLAWFKEEGVGVYDVRERIPELAREQQTPVLVAVEGKLAALLGIADPLKDSAKRGVAALHAMGVETVMLTGDDKATADVIAKQVGVDVVRAQLLPEHKLAELKKLQKKRAVAMVGDGINDAPALAQADVGIALGSGTAVAIEAGEVVLVRDEVSDVAASLGMARRTMRIVKQNLGWAFGYNIIAIPVAAGLLYPVTGWLLSPALAGAAMAFSSLSVVLNSLRLREDRSTKTS